MADGTAPSTKSKTLAAPIASVESCSNLPGTDRVDEILSSAVKWHGDSLTESPGATAILASIPPGFTVTDELLAFYAGDRQWDPDSEEHRAAALRPCLTINMLPRIYALAIQADQGQYSYAQDRLLRAWITLRNREAQKLYNYMVSAVAERTADSIRNKDARLISPDQAGRVVFDEYRRSRAANIGPWEHVADKEHWTAIAMAAINYYLMQPKVSQQ